MNKYLNSNCTLTNTLENNVEYKYFIINVKTNEIREANRISWENASTKYVCENNITLQHLLNLKLMKFDFYKENFNEEEMKAFDFLLSKVKPGKFVEYKDKNNILQKIGNKSYYKWDNYYFKILIDNYKNISEEERKTVRFVSDIGKLLIKNNIKTKLINYFKNYSCDKNILDCVFEKINIKTAINFLNYIDQPDSYNYDADEYNFNLKYENNSDFKQDYKKLLKKEISFLDFFEKHKISLRYIVKKTGRPATDFIFVTFATPVDSFHCFNFPKITQDLKDEYDDMIN